MKVALVSENLSNPFPIISFADKSWYRVSELRPEAALDNTIDVLNYEKEHPGDLLNRISNEKHPVSPINVAPVKTLIPFQPKAYRDFMLYEKHAINAARGFVKKYLPGLFPIVRTYEKLSGKNFPKLKPHKRYYRYPIYYLGNHLNFITHGEPVSIPKYTRELDYELELGVVICKAVKNATPEQALNAIGGFVVFNDFSARDVQLGEIRCGFGPMKAKNFINAISNIVITADEILPIIDSLKVSVRINNQQVAESTTAGMHYSLADAIAYASWEEQLHPGEFFGSGTVPDCSGIENGQFLKSGDTIRLEIEKIGFLENEIL